MTFSYIIHSENMFARLHSASCTCCGRRQQWARVWASGARVAVTDGDWLCMLRAVVTARCHCLLLCCTLGQGWLIGHFSSSCLCCCMFTSAALECACWSTLDSCSKGPSHNRLCWLTRIFPYLRMIHAIALCDICNIRCPLVLHSLASEPPAWQQCTTFVRGLLPLEHVGCERFHCACFILSAVFPAPLSEYSIKLAHFMVLTMVDVACLHNDTAPVFLLAVVPCA
jgi:hypothetical protein